MKKNGRKLIKKAFALMLAVVMAVPTVDYGTVMTAVAEESGVVEKEKITLRTRTDGKAAAAGYEEGAYVEWLPVAGANGYEVYVSQDQSDWTKIDDELIRSYGDYWRADALGLTAGDWHVKIKAVALTAGQTDYTAVDEKIEDVTVTAHDRSGYAWEGYSAAEKENVNLNTPGAYKKDGSLKDGAKVIYVTNVTKDTVSLKLEGTGETYTGIQRIIDGYKAGKETNALAVRIIGNVDDFTYTDKGDMAIENGQKAEAGITIEGVGEDAVANGWGIRVDKGYNIEIRNLAFMNCDSTEGDNIGLWQDNKHVWVHNCDFFYGEAGSDDDQKKGDGMLDCKKSDWVTFSYNHFWDSGKSSLLGLEENSNDYHATYHHNWFDHSDSRHPRVRYYTTHIYNNYYDGVAKYGIGGAAGGASIFSENNYFKNTNRPMIISMQGNDSGTLSNEEGSIIKSFGDYIDETSATNFIAYSSTAAVSAALETMSDFMKYVALDDEKEVSDVNDVIPNSDDVVDENDVESSDTNKTSEEEENIVTDADKTEDGEGDPITDTNKSEDEEDTLDTDADKSDNEEDAAYSDADENTVYDEAEVSNASSSADPSVDFDAYVAESRNETVPSTVKSKKGEHTYNNFDATDFYSYTPDAVEDVPDVVTGKAGRINGGDFSFTFTDADNSSSALNVNLKAQCVDYTTKLKAIGGIANTDAKIYYTVTFDPNNGAETYDDRVVEEKTLIDKPEDPTIVPAGKERFGGWYNGSRRWNFETDKVVKDMTLTGKWLAAGEEEDPYGRLPIGNEKSIVYDITTEADDSAYFDVKGNIDRQTGTSGTYGDVNYSSGGNDKKARLDLRNSVTITFTTTKTVRLILFLDRNLTGRNTNIDEKAYEQSNGIISTIITAGEHTITKKDSDFLYAIWTEPVDSSEQYTVTIDLADGSAKTTKTINAGEEIAESDMPETNRTGYKFKGWKDDKDRIIDLPYTPTGDVTLTAVWVYKDDIEFAASEIEIDSYSSSLEINGFTIMPSFAVDANSKTINGKTYTSRLKIDKGGTAASKSIKFTTTGAATLYIACISGKSSETRKIGVATVDGVDYKGEVSIDGNTVDCSDGNISVSGDNPGRYITLELPEANTYYIYAKDGGINFYYVSVTHKNVPDTQPKSYTVIFNTNSGTTVADQTVEEGQKCIKPTDPTKEGCTFAGWYTDSECTDGQEYDFDTPVTTSITLYAKWTDNGTENPTTYKVTFETNGGSAVAEETVESGKKCTKPADPTKEGCTFAGWYTDSEFTEGSEYNFDTATVTDNITLYAKWTDDSTEPSEEPGLHIDFVDKNETYTYTGSAIKPEIVVTNVTNSGRKIVLVEGVDYTVKYANNINASEGVTALNKQPTITVTGKGIYAGKAAPKQFTIKKKNLGDPDIKVGKIFVIDNSKASTPILYYGGMKLTTKNFEVKNKTQIFKLSDVNPKISLQGINNFKGDLDIDVEVVKDRAALKAAAKKFTVELNTNELKKLTYTGNNLENKIIDCITSVSDKTDKNVKLDSTKYAVAFSGNVTDAGTVKFTIVGLGEYSGCNVVKSCKILPRTITGTVDVEANAKEDKVLIEGMSSSLPYISTGAVFGDELKLTWITKGDDDKNVKLELVEGRDYKLSYSGNKKGGSTAKLSISFKGNYKGKAAPLSFTIEKAELSADTVKAGDIIIADKVCNAKNGVGVSGVYKSTPNISMDGVMVKASEYDVKYYTKEAMGAADEMTKQNQLEFETGQSYATVYVKITPKDKSNNYRKAEDNTKAEIKTSYKVWVKNTNKVDLSKAKVLFYKNENDSKNTTKLEYTGNAVEPGKVEVKVGRDTINNSKYGYKIINNVNKGKATVLIYAKDDTIGAKVVTYNIVSHSVGGFKW